MRNGHGTLALQNGATIAYQVRGHGGTAPVLLLRPLGSAAALWEPFCDALAVRHRIVTFDFPGSGASKGSSPGSTRSMAGLARTLLDHLGVARVHVYGQSLGGMVATWLAAEPGPAVRIVRLALASTSALGRDFANGTRGLGFAACALRSSRAIEACLAERILSRRFRKENPEKARAIVARAERGRANRMTLLAQSAAGALHDARPALGAIAARTAVLAGADDDVLGLPPQRALADAVPNARLFVVPNVGHDLTLEAPERVASTLGSFFDDDEREFTYR
jgi:pimeloyl-ACP methyl ester carboxylesterase